MLTSHRQTTSMFLAIVYLLMVLSPLAPFAQQPKMVAHAVTGECSGDCSIDGCSLERSANHTCCCWQKKEKESRPHDCCLPHRSEGRDEAGHEKQDSSHHESAGTVLKRHPCGSTLPGFTLTVSETIHLPIFYSYALSIPGQSILEPSAPVPLQSRPGDPPDPPPIITLIS